MPVEDAGYENPSAVLPVEDNMPAALHSAQAGSDILKASTKCRIVGQHLATHFKIVDVTGGLVFAPGTKGMSADARQLGFGTTPETIERAKA